MTIKRDVTIKGFLCRVLGHRWKPRWKLEGEYMAPFWPSDEDERQDFRRKREIRCSRCWLLMEEANYFAAKNRIFERN